eukprot:SAG22_NODE_1443_length_4412_cov_46.750058_3_plen_792_part_00
MVVGPASINTAAPLVCADESASSCLSGYVDMPSCLADIERGMESCFVYLQRDTGALGTISVDAGEHFEIHGNQGEPKMRILADWSVGGTLLIADLRVVGGSGEGSQLSVEVGGQLLLHSVEMEGGRLTFSGVVSVVGSSLVALEMSGSSGSELSVSGGTLTGSTLIVSSGRLAVDGGCVLTDSPVSITGVGSSVTISGAELQSDGSSVPLTIESGGAATVTATTFRSSDGDITAVAVAAGGSLTVGGSRLVGADGRVDPFPCDGTVPTCVGVHTGSVTVDGPAVVNTAAPLVCDAVSGECESMPAGPVNEDSLVFGESGCGMQVDGSRCISSNNNHKYALGAAPLRRQGDSGSLPLYFKLTLVSGSSSQYFGVIATEQPGCTSYTASTSYGFSQAGSSVYIAGESQPDDGIFTPGWGGWTGGIEVGDEAIFKLEVAQLSVYVARLGRAYTVPIRPADRDASFRVWVHLGQAATVELSEVDVTERFLTPAASPPPSGEDPVSDSALMFGMRDFGSTYTSTDNSHKHALGAAPLRAEGVSAELPLYWRLTIDSAGASDGELGSAGFGIIGKASNVAGPISYQDPTAYAWSYAMIQGGDTYGDYQRGTFMAEDELMFKLETGQITMQHIRSGADTLITSMPIRSADADLYFRVLVHLGTEASVTLSRVAAADRFDNPCDTIHCGDNGLCYVVGLEVACSCTHGYSGDRCEVRGLCCSQTCATCDHYVCGGPCSQNQGCSMDSNSGCTSSGGCASGSFLSAVSGRNGNGNVWGSDPYAYCDANVPGWDHGCDRAC